jgi:putative flavoprotein involved in K+ transport
MVVIGGGQSGLAAARAARDAGWRPVVLEAGARPVGSWPDYYDSLALFSPAEFSGFPGYGFPGDPGRYPGRDEVVGFLAGYADWLGVEIRTGWRVAAVAADGDGFVVRSDDGRSVTGDAVIAASGSFVNPHRPQFTGQGQFGGRLLHVADYRSPEAFAGRRVVVVGSGNSAVQVGHELAEVADVTLAVRSPIRFWPQRRGGHDMHYWFRKLGVDLLPPAVLSRIVRAKPVFDTGDYRAGLASGRWTERPLFTEITADGVTWADGKAEPVDVVILATGYHPSVPYLAGLGALDATGSPIHKHGLSLTHAGLGFLGLEFQRSFSSNTLRGVHRDAAFVVRRLTQRLGAAAGRAPRVLLDTEGR